MVVIPTPSAAEIVVIPTPSEAEAEESASRLVSGPETRTDAVPKPTPPTPKLVTKVLSLPVLCILRRINEDH